MEAYTSFPYTIKYYNYSVVPFNFMFIINVTVNSSAQYFKQEMDLWINAAPEGKIVSWVVRIYMKSHYLSLS